MAVFPIQYTEALPPAVGPSVPLRLDISTGVEYIARGMESLGQAFMQVAERQDTAELSTMKRQLDETTFAAFNVYSQTGDEEGRKAIVQKWSQDADKIQSKSGRVNNAFQMHKNNVLPDWGQTFAKQELAIKNRQADDADKINIQSSLEKGDIGEASKIIMNRQHFNRMSQADAENQIKELPANSTLAQARIDIGNGRYQEAITKLSPEFRKKLSGKQLDYADDLERMAQQSFKQNTDAAEIKVISDMHANRDKTSVEKSVLGEQYITQLRTVGLTGERYGVLVDKIQNWVSGAAEAKHPIAVARFQTMATDIWRAAITKEQFKNELLIATTLPDTDPNSISPSEFATLMKDADTELKASQSKALSQADEDAGRILVDYKSEPEWLAAFSAATTKGEKDTLTDKRKLQFENLSQYNRELRDWLAANPEKGGKEFYQFAEGMRYHYMNHTIAEIQRTIKTREEEIITGKPVRPPPKKGESLRDYTKRTGE